MNTFKDNVLDSLPHGWTADRLKDVVSLRTMKTDEPSAEEDYLELEDMESGTGRILGRRNTLEVESAVTLFKKGDVLFGKLRPYLEKYWQAEFDGRCTGEILALRPERVSSRFLFYCIASSWFIDRCNAFAYGAKMPRVSWSTQLAQFNIPIPSRSEQDRISAFLDEACASVDAAVLAKRLQLETLEAVKKAVITQAVTTGVTPHTELKEPGIDWIGKIPRHWKIDRLKRLTSLIVDGSHVTPTYVPEGVPFLRVTDIQDDAIDFKRVKYVSPEEHRLLSARAKAKRGDILLSKNGTVGIVKVVDWEWEFSFFVSLCLLRPEPKLNPRYFSYFFASSLVDQQLFQSSKQTSVTNLHLVKIRDLRLCVPPVEDQAEIVEHLDARCAELRMLSDNIEKQIETLLAYRKSLIHECVTGKRRITDGDIRRVEADVTTSYANV